MLSQDWPDYVFAPDYELLPLPELAERIQAIGHLPGMPSARDVRENGISLGETQAKLLEKVEELTLHVIALDERLGEIQRENARLRALALGE